MKHAMDEARLHATNTLNEVNRHMRSGKITNPRHYEQLTNMMNAAMDTLDKLDRYDDRHNNDARYNDRRTNNDLWDAVNDAATMIDEVVNRRGVPGSGRGRVRVGGYTRRRPRAEMDTSYTDDRYNDRYNDRYDDRYNDDMDYDDDIVDARGRRGRVRVSGYTRRRPSYAMTNMDARNDDDYDDYGDVSDRRGGARRRDRYGRFMTADDDTMRMVADAAAETARRMTNDRYNRNDRNDRGDIYPHVPLMPRTDDRYDERMDDARRADTTDTRTSDIGPTTSRMRR